MTPRSYTLGKRADTSEATRRRILEAAVSLYGERGVAATTARAVATRADVSRGTIVHHFGPGDGLLNAVLDHVVGLVEMPDERILEGLGSRDDRIRRLVASIFEFFERSTRWWNIFGSEMQLPALQAREREYEATFGRLCAAALGDLAGDRLTISTVAGFLHPAMLGTMRAAGATLEEVIQVVGDALVDFVGRQPVGRPAAN